MSIYEHDTTSLPLIGILIAVELVVNRKYFWFRVNCVNESFRPNNESGKPIHLLRLFSSI